MTDRPFAGGVDTAAGPMPGYYPDPSIPGFVRYWGGGAWVPGTSRPAPVDGEVLEPPRFVTRQVAPPVTARYVPPPASPASPEAALPVVGPLEAGSARAAETGPVFFDQTSAGASFTMAPHAELELRPAAAVAPWGATLSAPDPEPQRAEPVPVEAVRPEPVRAQPARVEQTPEPLPPAHPVASVGWHADPNAQRGLLESDDAPRWVSWGAPPEVPAAPVEPAPVAARAARPAPSAETRVEVPAQAPPRAQPPAKSQTEAPAESSVKARAEATVKAQAPAQAQAPARTPAKTPAKTQAPAKAPAPRRKPPARPVAGLGRRLAARLIDSAVLAVVAVAAGSPLLSSALDHVQTKLDQARMASELTHRDVQVWLVDPVVVGKAGVLLGVLILVGFLYEVLPTARTGQTFGKRIARVRVVEVRGGGSRIAKPPTFGRSTARWLVGLFSAVLLIGLAQPLFDRTTRRGWQDRAAGTRVVRA